MTPLVLLPGMMCDARLFAPQIAAIHDRAVMVTPIIEHNNMRDLAADVLDNAPSTFILGGLSMGGIVAMEVLRQASKRIEGLILIDTNPLAETQEMKTRRSAQLQRVRTSGLAKVMREEMKPNYLAPGKDCQPALDLCMDMALTLGEEVFINQSLALRDRRDQQQTLRQYQGPALILHGINDQLCPASRHTLMHELITHSQYEVIEDAGHLPTIEQPQATNAVLKGWLNECRGLKPFCK